MKHFLVKYRGFNSVVSLGVVKEDGSEVEIELFEENLNRYKEKLKEQLVKSTSILEKSEAAN